MKKMIKNLLVMCVAVVMMTVSIINVCAASAQVGDTVTVTVEVSGINNIATLTAQMEYDKEKLDLLEANTLQGMGAENTTQAGIVIWGALFDPANGSDFTQKTDVFNVIFIAKQEISDIDSLLQFKVRDSFDINRNNVDVSHMSYSVSSGGDLPAVQTESSAASEDTNASQQEEEDPKNVSSAASEATSSAVSAAQPSGDTKTQSETTSSKTEKNSDVKNTTSEKESDTTVSEKEKENEKQTDTAVSSEKLTVSYDESEFASVPPIKLDTQDTASQGNSKGRFPVGAAVGIAVCFLCAAIGFVVLLIRKKS